LCVWFDGHGFAPVWFFAIFTGFKFLTGFTRFKKIDTSLSATGGESVHRQRFNLIFSSWLTVFLWDALCIV